MVGYGTRLAWSKMDVVVRGPRGVKAVRNTLNLNEGGRPVFYVSFWES